MCTSPALHFLHSVPSLPPRCQPSVCSLNLWAVSILFSFCLPLPLSGPCKQVHLYCSRETEGPLLAPHLPQVIFVSCLLFHPQHYDDVFAPPLQLHGSHRGRERYLNYEITPSSLIFILLDLIQITPSSLKKISSFGLCDILLLSSATLWRIPLSFPKNHLLLPSQVLLLCWGPSLTLLSVLPWVTSPCLPSPLSHSSY